MTGIGQNGWISPKGRSGSTQSYPQESWISARDRRIRLAPARSGLVARLTGQQAEKDSRSMMERDEAEKPVEETGAPRADEPESKRRRRHASSIEAGVALITAELKNLSAGPRGYPLLDAEGNALYVGKAPPPQNRGARYTPPAHTSNPQPRLIPPHTARPA